MVLWLYDIMIYNKYTFNLVPFWHVEKEMATHSSGQPTPENPVDSGAWWAAVRGVAESRTQLK